MRKKSVFHLLLYLFPLLMLIDDSVLYYFTLLRVVVSELVTWSIRRIVFTAFSRGKFSLLDDTCNWNRRCLPRSNLTSFVFLFLFRLVLNSLVLRFASFRFGFPCKNLSKRNSMQRKQIHKNENKFIASDMILKCS